MTKIEFLTVFKCKRENGKSFSVVTHYMRNYSLRISSRKEGLSFFRGVWF